MAFNLSGEDVVNNLESSVDSGLSSLQVEEKREKYGYNELVEEKKRSLLLKFFDQFKDAMIIMLMIAALVSILVDPTEWLDSLIIMIVVIFNAIIGLVQESKAEESLAALKKMSSPLATVLRDNKKVEVAARDVVVGDIIFLNDGDYVVADIRILNSANLKIDESSLTGESVAVEKNSNIILEDNLALGDQSNMAFASSYVTYGKGMGVVTKVGMDREIGKIASMLNTEENELTPLQVRLAQIGKLVGYLSLVIVSAVFVLEYFSNKDIIGAFKTAVALAVAAIPEGLPSVVTVVLAIGVNKMAKKNTIIRKLPAVETLGSASIVCSDKTGTLTLNQMNVLKVYLKDQEILDLDENLDNQEVKKMLDYFTLSSDGEVNVSDDNVEVIGDPTETALIMASLKFNQSKKDLLNQYTYVSELPFDSDRKMMSVIYKKDGKYLIITKGAPDVIFRHSNSDNEVYNKVNSDLASQALRVLAVAYKEVDSLPEKLTSETIEENLNFVGLVGMIDPPRSEVKDAIKVAKGAGIKTIMITGDHIITAKAIAKELNILGENDLAISGLELAEMSDQQLADNIEKYSVYARVAPEQKVRIVKAWQKHNQVVAMTGDGVNDSPALKVADIGCAMGITGSDVAKGVAEMILVDDNFSTIITAIKEGRGIYENIRKDVHFLLSSNIGEIVAIFFASLIDFLSPSLSFGVPLLPIHLLWVNLITDSLPAFAIGMEPISDEVMLKKPRPKDESMFAHGLTFTIIWQGFMIGILTLIAYIIGQTSYNHEVGMTMAFSTLAISELFHAYNLKSEHSILNKDIFNNKYLNMAFIFGLLLQVIIVYTPSLASIFRLVRLDFKMELLSLGLAFMPIVIVEIVKLFKKDVI